MVGITACVTEAPGRAAVRPLADAARSCRCDVFPAIGHEVADPGIGAALFKRLLLRRQAAARPEADRTRLLRAGGAADGDIADRVRLPRQTTHGPSPARLQARTGPICLQAVAAAIIMSVPRHRAACRRQPNMALRGTAMAYTLVQAARAVARDKSTIWRAVKSGKLSGSRDPVSGG